MGSIVDETIESVLQQARAALGTVNIPQHLADFHTEDAEYLPDASDYMENSLREAACLPED